MKDAVDVLNDLLAAERALADDLAADLATHVQRSPALDRYRRTRGLARWREARRQ